MRPVALLAALSICLVTILTPRPAPARTIEPALVQTSGRALSQPPIDRRGFAPMAIETTLASYSFDDGSGNADPQGWTAVDRTAQLGTFFHVDNFSGMGGAPWTPISGAQSLWCGVRPCASPSITDDECSYATLPGYGNGWDQRFQSDAFGVTGDVSIAFDIRYDVEAAYDFVYLEYTTNAAASWQTLATYTGVGTGAELHTVPAVDHAGSLRFRFRVVSDNAYSDEDGNYNSAGAAVIDNIVITDDNGTVDSQNFETEPVGFLFTMDFDWMARIKFEYGNHAALFDGDAVLQEDPLVTNSTNFWGFFDNSIPNQNVGCFGGSPSQPVVPFGKPTGDGDPVYIRNEVRSPEIPYVGVQAGQPVRLDFDVYTDLPLNNLVFYEFRVRSKVGGVWKQWRSNNIVYYNANKAWKLHSTVITSLIEAGATSIQVAVGARDMCEMWCGVYGNGACHSHGPLIDNVRVVVPHDVFIVTNTNDAGAGSLRQAILDVNASTGGGTIHFDIPGAGPFVVTTASPLPVFTRRVDIDGTTQPGYAGAPVVQVVDPSAGATAVFDLAVANSRVQGVHVSRGGSPGATGIRLSSDDNIVRACLVSDCGTGIEVSGSGNAIGGTGVGEGNMIFDILDRGVHVSSVSAVRNSILGNSIDDVGGLGIDLTPVGVNSNDLGDGDAGANGLQNHPVLTSVSVDAFSTTFVGSLSSTPSTVFRIEFFTSEACNGSAYGNGKTYVGFSNIMTDASGNGPFSEYFASPLPGGVVVTATVTDPAGNTSEFSPCIASVNTPGGTFVNVVPVDATTGTTPVTLTFDEVTADGSTSLVTGPTGPPLPGTFTAGDGIYYEISTTATFTGDIEVCISYNEGALLVPEGSLRLLHWDTTLEPDQWVDVTTSHDTGTNYICCTTTHLSPFALVGTVATGVGDGPAPTAFALHQNVPNPFNPVTTITYDVPAGGADVTIRVYDVSGRLVRTLVNDRRVAGTHQVTWDGRNTAGSPVSTGVYFYRMTAGSFVEARRMVLLK